MGMFGIVAANATVVTFTINNNPGDTPNGTTTFSPNSFPGFGDNVSSSVVTNGSNIYHYDLGNGFTPNITADFTESAALTSAGSGQRYYNDTTYWPQVDFLYSGSAPPADRKFYFTLTPTTSTNGVRINSFDLFGYRGASNHLASWTIYQDTIGGAVLDSGSAVIAGNYQINRTTVNTAALEYMGVLALEVYHTSGDGGGFALDNLNFDQIPEPSCSLLFVLGGLAALLKRRT